VSFGITIERAEAFGKGSNSTKRKRIAAPGIAAKSPEGAPIQGCEVSDDTNIGGLRRA